MRASLPSPAHSQAQLLVQNRTLCPVVLWAEQMLGRVAHLVRLTEELDAPKGPHGILSEKSRRQSLG